MNACGRSRLVAGVISKDFVNRARVPDMAGRVAGWAGNGTGFVPVAGMGFAGVDMQAEGMVRPFAIRVGRLARMGLSSGPRRMGCAAWRTGTLVAGSTCFRRPSRTCLPAMVPWTERHLKSGPQTLH